MSPGPSKNIKMCQKTIPIGQPKSSNMFEPFEVQNIPLCKSRNEKTDTYIVMLNKMDAVL